MNRKTRRRLDAAKARRERREKNAADPTRKRENSPEMSLGERLYRRYGESADWKNYQSKPMPSWGTLPPAIRRHWNAVAAECQKFAHEATVHTIKALVARNAERREQGEPGGIEIVESTELVSPDGKKLKK